MIIKSKLREETADCETIFFPVPAARGTRCFRVDEGKLYRFNGTAWEIQAVPVGKFWFNPNTKTMMVFRRQGGWTPLTALQKAGSAES